MSVETPQTKPPDTTRLVQVRLTEEAYRRIKVEAARTDKKQGDIVSEVVEAHLPGSSSATT